MQKNSITLGVVFFIFILCSLTYQPIVANENKIIDEYQMDIESDDCGCDEKSDSIFSFPLIGTYLYPIGLFLWIMFLLTKLSKFGSLHQKVQNIGDLLGCWWA